MHKKSIYELPISILTVPAVCAASTQNNIPYILHNAPSFSIGSFMPNTFDACVHTTNFVLLLIEFLKLSTVFSSSQGTTSATV